MAWPRREYDYLRPAARRVPVQTSDPFGRIPGSPAAFDGRSPRAREEIDWPARDPGPRPPAPQPSPPKPPPFASPVAEPPPPSSPAEVAAVDEHLMARQRLERERERVLADTRSQVVGEMLPVLDNLDRSLEAARAGSDPALIEGLGLVRKQFEDALFRMGLERIESLGQGFDPALFDAVAVVEVDDPALNGKVEGEWQRGYRLGDRIVRRPKVRVAQWSGL